MHTQPEAITKPQEVLPILEYKEKIVEALKTEPSLTIIGETGSGKTTQMPLFLLEILNKDKKIAMTQPRRVAARSVATYVAQKAGSRIGDEVGYSIRFEDHTTEGTRLTFMTDGILLRKIQNDPNLLDYDVIVVDEAHERSLNIDFTLGLLKQIQARRSTVGKPLQIIVTSATLEKEKFEQYFNQSPSIEVPGRLHPVDIQYEKTSPIGGIRKTIELAADKTKEIISQTEDGDILIFMPGKMEIELTIEKINSLNIQDIDVLPLYGEMSGEDQDKIFTPSVKRKVIVATNIAETSITIPGLKYVVDSGLIRQKEYDPETGIESLVTKYHAQSGSKQRAGRAGRTSPGTCYRLYTEQDFVERFAPYQTPEIQRSNLAHVVLSMKKIGIQNVRDFDFIDKPNDEAFFSAIETLTDLGALDESGNITKIGETMAELPLEPHMARMVLEGQKNNCVEEVATLAAFLGGRSIFVRPKNQEYDADIAHAKFKDPTSDFITLLKIWDAYYNVEPNRRGKWAFENFLNAKALAEIADIRGQLFRVLKSQEIQATSTRNRIDIEKTLTAGLANNLYSHSYRWKYTSAVKQGIPDVAIFPGSSTNGTTPSLFVCENVTTNAKGNTFARNVQVVNPEWIIDSAPQLITKNTDQSAPIYDETVDTSTTRTSYFLKKTGSNILDRQEKCTEDKAREAFLAYVIQGEKLEHFTKDKDVVKNINILFQKSLGTIASIKLTKEYEKKFKAAKIYSRETLQNALSQGADLSLHIEDYVTPEDIVRIHRENPDTLVINGKDTEVTYSYTGYHPEDEKNPNKFKATITLSPEDIFNLSHIPTLPTRSLGIFLRMNGDSKLLYPTDLESLQLDVENLYIAQSWNTWKNNQRSERINNFEPLTGELPSLPQPYTYGTSLFIKTPLQAYAGYKKEEWIDVFSIEYFKTQEEADTSSEKVKTYIQKIKERNQNSQEEDRLRESLSTIGNELQLLKKELYEGSYQINYHINEIDFMISEVSWANNSIQNNPSLVHETIRKARSLIEKLNMEQKLLKERTEKISASITAHYANIENIDQNLVDVYINEDGEEDNITTLSELRTDTDEVVARAMCINGEIVLKTYSVTKPFEGITYTDYNRILTPEKALLRKGKRDKIRKEWEASLAQRTYDKDIEYAEQEVREDRLKKAIFKQVTHPGTGKQSYDYTERVAGNKLTYTVIGDRQPTSEKHIYYFKVSHQTYNVSGNIGFNVFLQKPYPEDSPLYQEATPLKNEEVRKEEPKAPPVDLSSLEGLFGGGSVVKRK